MKAVIYARVSSREQQEGYSLPAQVKLLRDYAQKNGFEVVKEFTVAESAKREGRKCFNEMMEFLNKNQDVKIILCEKVDRQSRNFKDVVLLDDWLAGDQTREVHFVKQNLVISKNSKSYELLQRDLQVILARLYINNLSEEVKKGMTEKAEQGLYPAGAHIGYRKIEKVMVDAQGNEKRVKMEEPDPATAPLVEEVFKLYATGTCSLKAVANKVSDDGLRTKNGNRMKANFLYTILKDPFYYGDFWWGGKLYKGIHQPLITKEIYDKVQAAFKKDGKPEKITKHSFSLIGLSKCGICGCSMTAEIKKGKYIYYRCTNYKGKCGNTYITEVKFSLKFGNLFNDVRLDPQAIEWISDELARKYQQRREYRETTIAALTGQKDRLTGKISHMLKSKWTGQPLDKEEEALFEETLAGLKKEKEEIEGKLQSQDIDRSNYLFGVQYILELARTAYSLYSQRNMTGRREIILFLLSNSLFTRGNLSPVYNKPFSILTKMRTYPVESGRLDSNQRPPEPHSGALPGCATPRN